MPDSLKEEVIRLLTQMVGEPERQPIIEQTKLIERLIPEGGFFLTLEDLNSLILYLGFKTVTSGFFNYFFGGVINSLGTLKQGVDKLRKDSMLYFGNFKNGFETLAKLEDPESFLSKVRKVPNLAKAPPRADVMAEIESLTPEQAHALGYTTESSLSQKELMKSKNIGRSNAERYLAMHPVDVYIAASMRNIQQFKEADAFIRKLFDNEKIRSLCLRYFNPLIAHFDDSTQKGLMESLMLRKASAMIYVAGPTESFGKDVELASMLVQGKPVMVYANKRYRATGRLLRESHPLRLQVELATGVAHGLIVANDPGVCAEILYAIFTDSLETFIEEDEHNYYLYEKRTGSQIRVVTKNPYLENVFWDFWPSSS